MTATLKTRTIAGHTFTFVTGNAYIASRPMAECGVYTFDVSITRVKDNRVIQVIPGLSYDDANTLLNEFNNGRTSYEGRIW